jgi:hypothetical protein
MPTGYTAKIIEGEITDFKDFAKLCIRNFGATIHMRDDSLDSDYTPDEVPNFYLKNIESSEKKLELIEKKSDEEIINDLNKDILNDIKYYEEKIAKMKIVCKRLNDMYKKALNFKLLSDDYLNYKLFLIDQLKTTIEYDCDIEYYEKHLKELNERYKSKKDPNIIRDEIITELRKDIKYYKNTYNEQKTRVKKANDWVQKIFNQLETEY